MPFYVDQDGKRSPRYREGEVTLAGILSSEEFRLVDRGILLALSERGGILSLDSPLSAGQIVTLRPPQPQRDFAAFRFPINRAGEDVGVQEMLDIRRYEAAHHVDLSPFSLEEIRARLSLAPPLSADEAARALLKATGHNREAYAMPELSAAELQPIVGSLVKRAPAPSPPARPQPPSLNAAPRRVARPPFAAPARSR